MAQLCDKCGEWHDPLYLMRIDQPMLKGQFWLCERCGGNPLSAIKDRQGKPYKQKQVGGGWTAREERIKQGWKRGR